MEKILVVDDDTLLIKMLSVSLSEQGYECAGASDGEAALKIADSNNPDLFILDMQMPGMDGLQLCSALRNRAAFKDNPIIFLASADDISEKLKAFDAGAMDYITKPIRIQEVKARVNIHLELFKSRIKLKEYALEMERLAERRAEQLFQAERIASLGALSSGIAHEINNPASFISGNVQTLEGMWSVLMAALKGDPGQSEEDKKRLEFVIVEMPNILVGIKDGVRRIKRIVDSLKTFSQKEKISKVPFNVVSCLRDSVRFCRQNLANNNVVLKDDFSCPEAWVLGDSQLMEQVFTNLIANAIDVLAGRKEAAVDVNVVVSSCRVEITVSDNGPGIKQEMVSRIWEPFYSTKERGKGMGLGLFICRAIVEAHDGRIGVSLRKSGGAVFDVSLPCAGK